MTVKTGTAWAGSFVTLDSTGALAASADAAGTLYVDGVANAATVTVTGTNPYKWSVTLPSLTAGQRVDMYITGTIDSVATAGFVASEQADTALVSEVKAETALIVADTGTDGVKIASAQTVATVTNLTNLPTMPTDWVTAAGLKTDAVTKIQNGLATPTNITAASGVTLGATQGAITWAQQKIVADVEFQGALDIKNTNVNGVGKSTFGGMTGEYNYGVAAAGVYNQSEEGVGVYNEGYTFGVRNLGTDGGMYNKSTGLGGAAMFNDAQGTYGIGLKNVGGAQNVEGFDPLQATEATLTAIQADLDNPDQYKADVSGLATQASVNAIPTTPLLAANYVAPNNSGIASILEDTGTTIPTTLAGLATSAEVGAIALLGETVIGSYTVQDILKILAAKMVGKATGGGTATITYRGVDDTSDVIIETVDSNGNRSAVTLTV